jgi:LETM1 and EF-hand domain-containing protein 1
MQTLRYFEKVSKILPIYLFQKTLPNKPLQSLKKVSWVEGESSHKKHTMLHHIKSEALKTFKFCKIIYRDGNWLLKKRYRMLFQDEPATIKEIHKMTNTKIDLLKMIPFSFFIIIPGAELTLPLCLYLFPNMIPLTFISKTKEEKNIVHLLDSRNVYADEIHNFMLKRIQELKIDDKEFNLLMKTEKRELSRDDLIEFHEIFRKAFNFTQMDAKTLLCVCRLLTMEPWTGFKVLGRAIFDPYYKLKSYLTNSPMESWTPKNYFCEEFSRILILFQLKLYLKKVRDEDYFLLNEDLKAVDRETLIKCCRERAIETEHTTDKKMILELKDWLRFSTHPMSNMSKGKVSHEFLTLAQIFPYLQDVIYLDADEDNQRKVVAGNERTQNLLKQISMKGFFDFNEEHIHRINERIKYADLDRISQNDLKSFIEDLESCIDEKHMPEMEGLIWSNLELLKKVSEKRQMNK